jgi:hypothetical protein
MFKKIGLLSVLFLAFLGILVPAKAEVSVGFGLSAQSGNSDFYFHIGQYYGVPRDEVLVVRDRRVPDDEIPVVFFLAREARVEPDLIVEERLAGDSWMTIMLRYRLDPDILYVPLDVEPGPPYGRAYGYWRHHRHFAGFRFRDDEVVNMVNLRFASESHGYRPAEVMRMRSQGRGFSEIVRSGRSDREDRGRWKDKGDEGRGKDRERGEGWGQDKGRGHGHGHDRDED